MTQHWDRSFVAAALRRQGYVLIPGCLLETDRRVLEGLIHSVRVEDIHAGDESPHSWREYHLRDQEYAKSLSFWSSIEAIVPRRLSECVSWINRFRQGQWIERHVDAGGDLQLLVCIKVPQLSSGGQFWVGQPEQVLPVGTGDALLFEASKLSHGTTMPRGDTTERITLNVRMWFDARP